MKAAVKKNRTLKKNSPAKVSSGKKSDITRETILSAARKVFATHTYNAASLRMIAKEGNFDHAIIRYYFPNKAVLFETVMIEACEKFCNANLKCLEGLEKANPTKGFSLYIDRVIDQSFNIQDVLKLFIQNITHIDTPESIPGYKHIPDAIEKIKTSFEENIPLKAPEEEIAMFVYGFVNLLINYLGANNCMSQLVNMGHESKKYRKWVKDSLMTLFLPSLKRLLFAEQYSDKNK
jgi:AcrR family transcriptional regulator